MLFQKKHKIGDTIAKLRKEKGWTQNELADKLQVIDKAISKRKSNKGDPSIEFLPALAELFGGNTRLFDDWQRSRRKNYNYE